MANLAKESAISLASGDIGSLLGTLGQNASNNEMPPEMMQLLSELPKWTAERASALDRIKQAYDEDPRMQMTPAQARGRAMFNNANPYDPGYSLAMGRMAEDEQNKYVRDSKVDREKAVLDALDLGTFDKLYTNVQKNLKGGSSRGFSGHTVDGGSYVLNNDTGLTEWVKAPVGATKFMTSVAKSMVDEAVKQGTYTPEMRDKIMQDAKKYYDLYTKAQPEVRMKIEQKLGIGEQVSEDVFPKVKPGSTVTIGDPNVPGSGNLTPEQLEIVKADVAKDKTVLPHGSIIQPIEQTTTETTPTFKTPQRISNEKAMGEGEYKVYEDYKEKLNSLQNASQQISAMEGMLESDKLNSGLFHEELNKVGGFLNYIDPKNQLAQNAGNDSAYYSKMMDLVRDKIKALGAGTAVSNLDLIVTQKSVGDLRNTPQGNLKIMALMKLANATMGTIMDEKVGYYDSKGNTFQGYKRDTTPTHALKYRLLPTGNWAFDVEDKNSWIERARVANGGKLPPDINARWKTYADNSVKNLADPDKLLKKGK